MIHINFITTWDRKCGIATHSKFLVEELSKHPELKINICPIKNPESTTPTTFLKLLKGIDKSNITHIQYQPSLFGYIPLPYLSSLNYFPLIISLLKFWKKNKVVTTIHEFVLNSKVDRLMLKFLNLSDKLIVHENKTRILLEKNGINPDKIIKISLGTKKGVLLDKEICKKDLNVSKNRVLTIFGFVQENKGHDILIDVLPMLDKDIILFIAGEARTENHRSYYNFLKEKVSSLGLDNRVRFLNFISEEDLPKVLGSTDIAIFPYRLIFVSGAFHLVLSYMIPSVTSDLDYFKEVKGEYNCIELFESGNKQDLFEKIKQLIDDEEKQKYLKMKCREFYEKTSLKAVAEKTKMVYLGLVS